jgi:outer membrane protein assembly factor BamB
VICLDINGMADGNQGPFKDEGQYMAGKGNQPLEIGATDADIIWVMNMTDECGVFPHNITSCSVMVVGDHLWTSTSNGVDYGHVETPAPNAPALICLDKKTGKLLGEEASGLSQRIFHSNWSSPAMLETANTRLVIFGGPDGVVYAFDTQPVKDEDLNVLKLVWQYDCNPPEYRSKDGKPIKYATRKGPSEVLGTPIVHDGLVYAVIGQDPEHGEGIGHLYAIDGAKRGDITDSGRIWHYGDIRRSISTGAVYNGLVFYADFSGFLHCVDAKTGKPYWKHDLLAAIWGSPMVVDGKVYLGDEDGDVVVLEAAKEEKLLGEFNLGTSIYSTPVPANGTLFIMSRNQIFALANS